jgi:O-antigen/teichoic acid export membrane protein
MFKRILGVFGVSAMGQTINLVLRIISMPVFLSFWGKDLYGEWLILLAIPSYLAISGTGLSVIAANEMAINASKGLRNEALNVFQSVWLFISLLSVFFLLLTVTFAIAFPVVQWLNIRHISLAHTRMALILLAFYTVFYLQGELLLGVYRAGGIFVKGLLVNNIIILAENIGLLIAVMLTSNILIAIAVYLAIRLLGMLTMVYVLKTNVDWFEFGVQGVRFKIIKSNLLPTLSFIGINISNAFTVQGIVAIIGIRLGAAAVVSFTAVRTIVNLIKQVNTLVYYSVWPEFSTAFAINNHELAKKLHRHACQFTFLFTLANIVVLLMIGTTVIRVWTNGQLEVSYLFLTLMLVAMVPNTFYVTSSYVLVSINKLEKIAVLCLVASLVSMGATYLTIPVLGIVSVPIIQMAVDIILLLIIVKDSLLLVRDKTSDFIQSMFSMEPVKRFKALANMRR